MQTSRLTERQINKQTYVDGQADGQTDRQRYRKTERERQIRKKQRERKRFAYNLFNYMQEVWAAVCGETGQSLHLRMNGHHCNIKCKSL